MTRLLLTPIALICLLAGALPLGVALLAASKGLLEGMADPALAASLRNAALAAGAATVPAAIVGLACAACIGRARNAARVVLGLAIVLLVLPAPILVLPGLGEPSLRELARFACAVARGAALVLLFSAHAVAGLDPALRRAARCAGATPLQAWRHAVLAAIWRPACLGALAAFLVALAQTPAAAILAPHLDLADAWIAPASLLLVACSAAALTALLGRPRQMLHD